MAEERNVIPRICKNGVLSVFGMEMSTMNMRIEINMERSSNKK